MLFAVFFVGFASFKTVRHFMRTRRDRPNTELFRVPNAAVLAADPITRVRSLSGLPVLLRVSTGDQTVPPQTNAYQAARQIGTSCLVRAIDSELHGDPRLYDAEQIAKFIARHAVKGTLIVELHGYGVPGSQWFTGKSLDDVHLAQANSKVQLTRHLQSLGYVVEAQDYGGNLWGNNQALRLLSAEIGKRKVVLIGESMGGILMWRFAELHRNQCLALVGISPVCNLKSICQTENGAILLNAYQH